MTSARDRLQQPQQARFEPAQGVQAVQADLESLWKELQARLQETIEKTQFYTWFQKAVLRSFDGRLAQVAVQNEFTRSWLVDHYRDKIAKAARAALGPEARVELVVDAELASRRASSKRAATQPADEGRPASAQPKPSGRAKRATLLGSSDMVLHPGYTFDNFVVGPCNRFAHAAAVGVSESPGRNFNPFFVHGSVGLGKTHLMQSLCRAILDNNPEANILFLSCETFVNHFISALENGDLQKFRQKYRDVDLLVVDDIHILANKERTQEEFFHTFNALYNAGKQIVLSSDSPPKDIPSLQERLVSRFRWGLVTEIEPPCYETRMAILKRKCRERGRELPEEVTKVLAERIGSNIRELEGAVNKLIGYSALMGEPITTDLARRCLQDVFATRQGPTTIDDVMQLVTEHFDVRLSELQSKKRTKSVVWPRQIGMYLARKVTGRSLQDIGGYFGGRDHTTVHHAVRKVELALTTDGACQDLLADLEARLRRG